MDLQALILQAIRDFPYNQALAEYGNSIGKEADDDAKSR
jgi:hypothetical protein